MLPIKHLLATICCLFMLTLTSQAQIKDSKRFAAIESEKIAYITKQLSLTPAEAQRFFPIYNQYSSEMWALKNAKAGLKNSPQGANSLQGNNKRDVIAYDAKEVDLKKEYRSKFTQVIGQSKASQFFLVEQEFRELLYKELQSRKNKR